MSRLKSALSGLYQAIELSPGSEFLLSARDLLEKEVDEQEDYFIVEDNKFLRGDLCKPFQQEYWKKYQEVLEPVTKEFFSKLSVKKIVYDLKDKAFYYDVGQRKEIPDVIYSRIAKECSKRTDEFEDIIRRLSDKILSEVDEHEIAKNYIKTNLNIVYPISSRITWVGLAFHDCAYMSSPEYILM